MIRFGAVVLAVTVAAISCTGGDGNAHSGPQTVTYRRVDLTAEQMQSLEGRQRAAMESGRLPSEFAMVVSPQPSSVPSGQVLVAASWESCGESLGRATWRQGVLTIELGPRANVGGVCGGVVEQVGLLVTLPRRATVTQVRLLRA
jgi:hypothetical protein